MPAPIGSFTDPDSLITLLRQRQHMLGLSNQALESVCGWAGGMADKYLGPARSKTLSVSSLAVVMEALGLSATLVVDDARAARMQRLWTTAGRRQDKGVRDKHRVGKAAIARARPLVMTELARKGGAARWAGSTPEARAAMIARMNSARLAKRRAGTNG